MSAATIVIADGVLLTVVVLFARKGADKLAPATFGIRRTAFWPAIGWMLITTSRSCIFNVVWLLVVGTGNLPRSEDRDHGIDLGRRR